MHMKIRYFNSETTVQEGDVVEYKLLLLFWKKKRGRVSYVPGVSKFNPEMEHNGLVWVGVSGEDGSFRGIYVDPESGYVKNELKFLERCKDKNYFTPEDIKDDEW